MSDADGPTDVPSSVPAVGGDKEQQQEAASLGDPRMSVFATRTQERPTRAKPPSPSVPPAATDDEAALAVIAESLADIAHSNVDPLWAARTSLAALHAQGYRIVKDQR